MTQPTDNTPRPDPESTTPIKGEGKPQPGNGSGLGVVILLNVTGFVVVALLLAWLVTTTELRGRFVPFTQEQWGTVQTVRYVGSFGPTTQVETDRKIFLVRGIVNLDKGIRLVRRKDFFGQEICIDGSNTCWELLGN